MAAISKLRGGSAKHLASIFRKESSDKCIFPKMTSFCSTSEYRPIIYFNAHFDPPKLSLKTCSEYKERVHLMPVSDDTNGCPESAAKYAYSKKSTVIA